MFKIGDKIVPIGEGLTYVPSVINHFNEYWSIKGRSHFGNNTQKPYNDQYFYVIGADKAGSGVNISSTKDGKGPHWPSSFFKLYDPIADAKDMLVKAGYTVTDPVKKVEGWVRIYEDYLFRPWSAYTIHNTKEEAMRYHNSLTSTSKLLAVLKFVEGDGLSNT